MQISLQQSQQGRTGEQHEDIVRHRLHSVPFNRQGCQTDHCQHDCHQLRSQPGHTDQDRLVFIQHEAQEQRELGQHDQQPKRVTQLQPVEGREDGGKEQRLADQDIAQVQPALVQPPGVVPQHPGRHGGNSQYQSSNPGDIDVGEDRTGQQ